MHPRQVTQLAESEPSPSRRIRVRAFTDGTTLLRFRPIRPLIYPSVFGLFGLFLIADALAVGSDLTFENVSFAVLPLVGGLFSLRKALWCRFGGEELAVTRAAVVRRRRRLTRPDVWLLSDVTTVVVSGEGESSRLDVQLGRQRQQILEDLRYEDAHLRWVAQRLRGAIDLARTVGND